MAKMFYTLEEAAEKLGKSADDVRAMAERNEIDEFRDGDQLMFKVQQIDLLADGDASASGMISLTDSAGGTGLGIEDDNDLGISVEDSAGVGISLEDSAGNSGGGIMLDADDVGVTADASEETLITDDAGIGDVSLESFGSGSGLMDLTRESDGTGFGGEGLLDDLYADEPVSQDDTADQTADGADLFAGGTAAQDLTAAAPVASVAVEAVDPKFSGLAGGLSIGMLLAALVGIAALAMGAIGGTPDITGTLNIADMGIIIPMAGLLIVTVVLGVLGMVMGGKSG